MDIVKETINWIRNFINSDAGMIISFSAMIVFIVQVIAFIRHKIDIHRYRLTKIILISSILLLGVIFPVIVLSFSPWSGWIHIALNCLAIYCLINFLILLYIIRVMVSLTRSSSKAKKE